MNKILGLVLLLICSVSLVEAATVRLEPAVIRTEMGKGFTVNVIVEDVTNLMGAEINIGFDPTKLESGTASEGELLSRYGATPAFFPATSTGRVGFAASRLSAGGIPAGVTGSGTIAVLNFRCIADDPGSLLSIDSTDLRDDSLQAIPVTGTFGTTVTAMYGTVTVLMIEPAWGTATSGGTISYTATAQDTAGNTWTVAAAFSSDDPGGTFTRGGVYTAGRVGTWTITGSHGGVSGTATVVVLTYGTATVLMIEPVLGTVTSGAAISYTATARDAAGNTWTVTAAFSIDDPGGTFTAGGVYTAGRVGTWTITGKYAGVNDGTATVVVTTHGTATALLIEPAWCTAASGGTLSYTATALDAAGNTWTVTATFGSNDPGGTFTTDGVYTAGGIGTWTITGKYAGMDGTATVVVTHGTATALLIEPACVTAASGGTISYTATAQDVAGNTWTVTAAFGSNDPGGTFTTGGVYTAGKIGTWTITGMYGGVSGTATAVVLTHGTATTLTIEPALGTVTSGAAISYTATARDAAGNTWTVTAAFSSDDPGGTFTTGGVYTAGRVGTWTITGKYAGVNDGTATVVVTHGIATALTIEPACSTSVSGETVRYTAIARDAAGNTWTVTAAFGSDDPEGTFTAGGVYAAGRVGTWTITGVYGMLDDTAMVIVMSEPVRGIALIEPASISTQMCNQPFSLLIITVDKNSHHVPYSGTLTLSDLTGSISPVTVQMNEGTWTGMVTVSRSLMNDRITFEAAGMKCSSNSFDVLIDDASDETIYDDSGVVTLEIRAGSVESDYCLGINREPSGYEINQANYQAGTASILSDTLCEIEGTTADGGLISYFQRPAILSLIYNPEGLGNIDVKTLRIYRLQGSRWIPVASSVYPDESRVTTQVNEPGIFVLRGVAFGNTPSDVVVYPNPCRNAEIIFRNLPSDICTIEIYDLAGDLMRRVHHQGATYQWDTRDDSGRLLDSGVYFYVVVGKKENACGKVVIIR